MRKAIYLPLLAGLAFAAAGCEEEVLSAMGPAEAVAQAGPEGGRRGPGMRGPGAEPLGRLLERREELELTAEQVTRLEALAAQLEARNEPLRAQIQAAMPERPELTEEQRQAMRERRRQGPRGERPQLTDEQREAMRARRDALRPLMEQVAENRRATMQEVREILTEAQEAKLREGMRRPGRRGAGGRR